MPRALSPTRAASSSRLSSWLTMPPYSSRRRFSLQQHLDLAVLKGKRPSAWRPALTVAAAHFAGRKVVSVAHRDACCRDPLGGRFEQHTENNENGRHWLRRAAVGNVVRVWRAFRHKAASVRRRRQAWPSIHYLLRWRRASTATSLEHAPAVSSYLFIL